MLSPAQSVALRHIEAMAEAREAVTLSVIAGGFERAGLGLAAYREVVELARQYARFALHFHPDRLGSSGCVVESLLREGIYRNQFETGLSNGSPTASSGSERDGWERTLFGGAYHAE